MSKVVYKDGDYTKVARGNYTIEADFITVTDALGNTIRIGKNFVISIKDGD